MPTQQSDVLATVLASKEARSAMGTAYNDAPRITFVLQFFNKRQNIPALVAGLREVRSEEIIVIDDGSVDGSHEEWLMHLDRPNDFLLHCNDLYEVRTYDRAIRMARGEFVCLLQDDDLFPAGRGWVDQALALFERFPNLLLLSGRQGVEIAARRPEIPFGAGWAGGGRVLSKPRYVEQHTQIPFMFTMAISRAPVFIRRQPFLAIGGIDQDFAPFMCDDIEASLRAWLAGYTVGFYNVPFRRSVGGGGMQLYNADRVSIQDSINIDKIHAVYGKELIEGTIQRRVQEANATLVQVRWSRTRLQK